MLNEKKLSIYFDAVRETQGEETYQKMVVEFGKIVDDRVNDLYAIGEDEPGQKAYIESVDILVEIYDKNYPKEFVEFVNEKATAQTR